VDVIPELLLIDKPLMRYRTVAMPDILSIVIRVFQSLLSIKNIPLLEKIYKYDIYQCIYVCIYFLKQDSFLINNLFYYFVVGILLQTFKHTIPVFFNFVSK